MEAPAEALPIEKPPEGLALKRWIFDTLLVQTRFLFFPSREALERLLSHFARRVEGTRDLSLALATLYMRLASMFRFLRRSDSDPSSASLAAVAHYQLRVMLHFCNEHRVMKLRLSLFLRTPQLGSQWGYVLQHCAGDPYESGRLNRAANWGRLREDAASIFTRFSPDLQTEDAMMSRTASGGLSSVKVLRRRRASNSAALLESRVDADARDVTSVVLWSQSLFDAPPRASSRRTVGCADMPLLAFQSPGHVMTDFDPEMQFGHYVYTHRVFSSVARPYVAAMYRRPVGASIDFEPNAPPKDADVRVGPLMIVKEGDDLLQDAAVMAAFVTLMAVFESHMSSATELNRPELVLYDVLPTGDKRGVMEMVEGSVSLKDFDWEAWQKTASFSEIKSMLRTTAGTILAGYVLGLRDRHSDNLLVRNKRQLFHIDFGYVLGRGPPVDGPSIVVTQGMYESFVKFGAWTDLLDLVVRGYRVMRIEHELIVRAIDTLFEPIGYASVDIVSFVRERLRVGRSDSEAEAFIRAKVMKAPNNWQMAFKNVSHKRFDPLWYSLLQRNFPPAVLAMKLASDSGESDELPMSGSDGSGSAQSSSELSGRCPSGKISIIKRKCSSDLPATKSGSANGNASQQNMKSQNSL